MRQFSRTATALGESAIFVGTPQRNVDTLFGNVLDDPRSVHSGR